jgi:hypothetical protein
VPRRGFASRYWVVLSERAARKICGVLRAWRDNQCRRSAKSTTQEPGEMTEFLAQMPTDTMTFLTTAVLSLAATLVVLRL